MQATTERPPAPPKTFVNEAGWDRALRIVIGVVLLYLGWSGVVSGAWGTVFRYFGLIPLATGVFGWCALYRLLRISTCRT